MEKPRDAYTGQIFGGKAEEVAQILINGQNAIDPPFISLSLVTDEMAQCLNSQPVNLVNETILEDYSETSLNSSTDDDIQQSTTSHQITTRVLESLQSLENLTEQHLCKITEGIADDEADEDILPPSPTIVKNAPVLSRTPVSLSRSSAISTSVIGSPSVSSSRTLRNVEKAEINLPGDRNTNYPASVKSLSLSVDSNREMDQSTSKHVVSSSPPHVPTKNEDIESDVERLHRRREEDNSDSESFSVNLMEPTQSPLPCSQDLLSTSPFRDPPPCSQETNSHFVECFQTQDIIHPRPVVCPMNRRRMSEEQMKESNNEPVINLAAMEHLQLHLENPSSLPLLPEESQVLASKNPVLEAHSAPHPDDTIEHMSASQNENISDSVAQPFEVVTRIYDPKEKVWILRTFSKMLSDSKLQVALLGSDSDHLGLLRDVDFAMKDFVNGSSIDSFVDVLQKNSQSISSGYNADVSASLKSDCISQRMSSRFSIASTMSCFETVPIACSSMLNRTSLESKFAIPTKPVRQQKQSHPVKEYDSNLVSQSSFPDATKSQSDLEAGILDAACPLEFKNKEANKFPEAARRTTELNITRKRGHKSKGLNANETTVSTAAGTPRRKGLPGRPQADGTLGEKETSNPKSADSQSELLNTDGTGEIKSLAKTNFDGQSSEGTPDKSSNEYLKEAEEAWRESRRRSFEIGKLVFAQWTDKYYYAAKIMQRDPFQSGKWTVKFEDGQTRSLVEEFILPYSVLSKNQSVLVLNESLNEGQAGIVVGYDKISDQHIVEIDGNETIKVPMKRICMTPDQLKMWSELLVVPQLFSPHTCNISLDNIVGGKRRRATTAEGATSSPKQSLLPRTPRATTETSTAVPNQTPKSGRSAKSVGSVRKGFRGKRDLVLDSSTLSESSGTTLLEEERALRTRILDRLNLLTPSNTCNIMEEERDGTSEMDQTDARVLGPIPGDSKLFSGFAFILTKATRKLEVDPENMNDELDPYLDPAVYNKAYLRQQLLAGGGIVLERFDQSQLLPDNVTVLVICNRPCTTERYIRSLAAQIRAVSHVWVIDCCQKNTLLPHSRYFLPPGFDLGGSIVEWSTTTGRCFVGTRILLVGSAEFNDLWVPILVQAECVIVSRLPAHQPRGVCSRQIMEVEQKNEALHDDCSPFDYVVTSNHGTPSPAIIQQARRMSIPICSSVWLIQSLIHGKVLDPCSSADFHFTFDS